MYHPIQPHTISYHPAPLHATPYNPIPSHTHYPVVQHQLTQPRNILHHTTRHSNTSQQLSCSILHHQMNTMLILNWRFFVIVNMICHHVAHNKTAVYSTFYKLMTPKFEGELEDLISNKSCKTICPLKTNHSFLVCMTS